MIESMDWPITFLDIADVMSTRSHCCSKKVCAIAVKKGRIIGTGINGSLSGQENCDDVFKDVDLSIPENRQAHHDWFLKHELHAEQNLIIDLAKRGVSIEDSAVFVSMQPCETCARLLAQCKIREIYWRNFYDKGDLYETLDALVSNSFVYIQANTQEHKQKIYDMLKEHQNSLECNELEDNWIIFYRRPRTMRYECQVV